MNRGLPPDAIQALEITDLSIRTMSWEFKENDTYFEFKTQIIFATDNSTNKLQNSSYVALEKNPQQGMFLPH